jgi:hypothetical protein
MPRKPPPPHAKGAPRTPGSGRRKGTPNRKTVAMRELMTALLNDVDYQHRRREDFRHRRIHPSIEALVWAHVIGKPTEKIEMSANVTMEKKLAEELEVFSRLSLEQLEELAAQSQALVDTAMAMANGNDVETTRRSPSLTPVTHPRDAVQPRRRTQAPTSKR